MIHDAHLMSATCSTLTNTKHKHRLITPKTFSPPASTMSQHMQKQKQQEQQQQPIVPQYPSSTRPLDAANQPANLVYQCGPHKRHDETNSKVLYFWRELQKAKAAPTGQSVLSHMSCESCRVKSNVDSLQWLEFWKKNKESRLGLGELAIMLYMLIQEQRLHDNDWWTIRARAWWNLFERSIPQYVSRRFLDAVYVLWDLDVMVFIDNNMTDAYGYRLGKKFEKLVEDKKLSARDPNFAFLRKVEEKWAKIEDWAEVAGPQMWPIQTFGPQSFNNSKVFVNMKKLDKEYSSLDKLAGEFVKLVVDKKHSPVRQQADMTLGTSNRNSILEPHKVISDQCDAFLAMVDEAGELALRYGKKHSKRPETFAEMRRIEDTMFKLRHYGLRIRSTCHVSVAKTLPQQVNR